MRFKVGLIISLLLVGTFFLLTYLSVENVPSSFSGLFLDQKKQYFLDRNGIRLNQTYANKYNTTDQVELYESPSLFIKALLLSEDQNFYTHDGVDWSARRNALWQNIKAMAWIRGASTITEQVVKMLHPRSRSLWIKWIEGLEAQALEKKIAKADILRFYINQVPYASQRRGIKQAANYYFNRDLQTLSNRELLALVVLIRSPKWYDPFKSKQRLDKKIAQLADRLYAQNIIDRVEYKNIISSHLSLSKQVDIPDTSHFIDYVSSRLTSANEHQAVVHTTLDIEIQTFIQETLNSKIKALNSKNVHNGAVLVVDHQKNEVVAWVVAYAGERNKHFNSYDPIVVPRQPGSTLKPFLYAQALEKGWEASTLIDDSPLSEGVGSGIHSYHNYSNNHYGLVTVRQALGNSLNIPAIKAIQYVGADVFLDSLHDFGITTLDQHPNYYGDGIALGNSEVTLFELTRAYTVFANMGKYNQISVLQNELNRDGSKEVLPETTSSLIADILSDSTARAKEFGINSILNFPHQTAVKTGTSSDYRDAWTIGFDDKYTVGVWFGNLDYQSMDKVTGSVGPAHVLRTIFSYLGNSREDRSLFLSRDLTKKRVCLHDNKDNLKQCTLVDEYYIHPDNEPILKSMEDKPKIIAPSKNLILAKDPRIADDLEYYIFTVSEIDGVESVEWYLDDTLIATTKKCSYDWKVERGKYRLHVKIFTKNGERVSNKVLFTVM